MNVNKTKNFVIFELDMDNSFVKIVVNDVEWKVPTAFSFEKVTFYFKMYRGTEIEFC